MRREEIEKLRKRVEKEPNSRMFLPLAEEYRKLDMLDEAIAVLLRGISQHSGYTSARVALARIYLEKGMVNKAREELENVVRVVPDNLFAHKKLAEIYRQFGETDDAISEYREIIRLNPLDEDARACLENIEACQIKAEVIASPQEVSNGVSHPALFEGLELEVLSADAYVSSGDYYKALEKYRETLTRVPGNKHILQRIAELRGFLKLIGKGEDMLLDRLDRFLKAINARRDEFLKSRL